MKKGEAPTTKGFNPLTRDLGALTALTVYCVLALVGAFRIPNGVRDAVAESRPVGSSHGTQDLHAIGRVMIIIDGAENALLATDLDDSRRRSIYSHLDAAERTLARSVRACEGLPWVPEEARLWEKFVRDTERWSYDHEEFLRLARTHEQNRTAETYRRMSVQALEVNPASLSRALASLDAAIQVSRAGHEERPDVAEVAPPSYQEAIAGAIAMGAGVSVLAVMMLLVRRARRHRRIFRLGRSRLMLDVDRYRNLSSYVNPTRNVEKST